MGGDEDYDRSVVPACHHSEPTWFEGTLPRTALEPIYILRKKTVHFSKIDQATAAVEVLFRTVHVTDHIFQPANITS